MPHKLPFRTAALAVPFLIAGCASLLAPSEEERDQAASRVLAAYDVPGMLEQVAPIINDSLQTNLPPSVDEAERERLADVVRDTYEPEVLGAEVAERLRKSADSAERRGVLIEAAGHLEKPLAQDMIAREQKASSDEFASGFKEFLKQPVAEEDQPRLETARTLVERMKLVELQAVFNVGMLRGMVTARNVAASGNYRTSEDNEARMVEQTEKSLRERMNRQLPIMLFYAYREASDDEIQRYAELQNTPALAWVNEAIPEALAATLEAASRRLPERYRAQPGGADGTDG